MDEIILVGAGGHARSCIDVIEQHGCFTVAGLVENDELINEDVLGYPICKEFGFTAGMLKGSLAEGRKKK